MMTRPTSTWAVAVLTLAALVVASDARALSLTAMRARMAILELELGQAAEILSGEGEHPEVVIERGRLALYRGDCDSAVALLERSDLEEQDGHASLLAVAKGCARGTAATVVLRDEERGVVVRFQDDEDRPLMPIVADAVVAIRDALERDLGTRLPSPVWIDLVRDQLTLAALSGLPERAAQTTGTVAVAKWGRVMMISPRAAPAGYPWLDTLAHEMTHLVLSQATRERAPLWLQEGVAKRQETRWREATPFDGVPSADATAYDGIVRGLALPLDGLGPSIAMLPSPEQASIAFAEVSSFINFWVNRNGPEALPKLLTTIRDQMPGSDVSAAIVAVSSKSLADWDKQWRAHLAATSPALPQSLASAPTKGMELARRRRLGELLLGRDHHRAAEIELGPAQAALPNDASLRCLLADSLRGLGEEVAAARLFERPADVSHPSGRWWSLHDLFQMGDALPRARWHAIAHDPFEPPIPCRELPETERPLDPIERAICDAAWRMPR